MTTQPEDRVRTLQLTVKEREYLIRIVSEDLHRMRRDMDHAICYGGDVYLSEENYSFSLFQKILYCEN